MFVISILTPDLDEHHCIMPVSISQGMTWFLLLPGSVFCKAIFQQLRKGCFKIVLFIARSRFLAQLLLY